jgi:hypothetical protein
MEIEAPYSAIIDRPPLTLPGGARVAVWVIVNVEKWDIASPLPRTAAPPPAGATVVPDIPNYSWYTLNIRMRRQSHGGETRCAGSETSWPSRVTCTVPHHVVSGH